MIYVVCVVYMQFVLTFLVDQKHYIASACTIHLLSLVLFFLAVEQRFLSYTAGASCRDVASIFHWRSVQASKAYGIWD